MLSVIAHVLVLRTMRRRARARCILCYEYSCTRYAYNIYAPACGWRARGRPRGALLTLSEKNHARGLTDRTRARSRMRAPCRALETPGLITMATAPLQLLGLLQLPELRDCLLDAVDVQTRVRLRAVSRQLRTWAEQSLQTLHWSSPAVAAALEPRPGRAWSNRLAELLEQSGQDARWPACAAFQQAHATGDPSLVHSGMQNLRLLDLSLQNWAAAARGLSSRDVNELLGEARGSLRALRLDGADAILPFPGRCALFSKGSAYHAKVVTLPQLLEISASHAFGFGDDEATALALGCPQLQRLRISHDGISPRGWYELLSSLTGLEELDVGFSAINDDALLAPGSLLAPTPLACQCEAGRCRCPAKRRALRCFKAMNCPGVTDAALRQLLYRLRPAGERVQPENGGRMLPPPIWLTELRGDQGPADDHQSQQTSLVALKICSCGLSSGLELVAQAAQAGHLPALVELGLYDGQMRQSYADDVASATKEGEWLQTILQRCSALTNVDVRGCAGGGCLEPTRSERPLRTLRSFSAGFLLPALVGGTTGGPSFPSKLTELRLGLGARVNDALLCAVSGSDSAVSLRTVEVKFGVFEDSGLVRCNGKY